MDLGKAAYDLASKIKIDVEKQFSEMESGDIDAGTFTDAITSADIDGGEF